jgi:beta-alanine--pyruvate transaminase
MNKRAEFGSDLEQAAFWMPFTANRQFKKAPRLLARAEGMYYWTPEGARCSTAPAGLWCVNAGHCRPKIVEAVKRQVATMDFAPTVPDGPPDRVRNSPTGSRASRPKGFSRVFFTNSGSESVDTALKIALA